MENQQNNLCCGQPKAVGVILGVLLAVLAVYVAVLAVNAIMASKYIGRESANQATISVAGTGDVSIKPDLAAMDFSVVSEAKTVADATADNNAKMNAIIDVAKSLGVDQKDLQTAGYSVNPRYDYVRQEVSAPSSVPGGAATSDLIYPSGKRILSGYDVTQTLTVKMRGEMMNKIGQIIEEATAAGANQVGDLQFTVDDPDAVQAQAREIAIKDAKSKAEILAKQLNVKLVRITGYSDGGGYYPIAYAGKGVAMDTAQGVPAPNIQTGENKITVSVNINYEIE
jgi:hypothetical protein